jgi:hypothetical protein
MEEMQKKCKEMGPDEAMKQEKMLFQCLMDKPTREKIHILRTQRDPKEAQIR